MKNTSLLINTLIGSNLYAIWLLVTTQLLLDPPGWRNRLCRPVNLFLIIAALFWAMMLLSLLVPTEAKADGIDNAPVVEIFTDRAHPLTNTEALPGATVYRIDRLVILQERLSRDLPADEQAAVRIAKQRAADIDREAMTRTAEGLAIAHLKYRLDRYPAIVFAGQSVIYGVTDLALAKRIYDESRSPARSSALEEQP